MSRHPAEHALAGLRPLEMTRPSGPGAAESKRYAGSRIHFTLGDPPPSTAEPRMNSET